MTTVTVSIYDEGLLRAMGTDGQHWNKKTADEVMTLAIEICPSRSGHLASCHGVEQNRGRSGFTFGFNVYNDATNDKGGPLALWRHNGTGLYGPRGTVIVPVNTPKKKYMHVPAGMGWRWTHLSRGIRVYQNGRPPSEPDFDPFDHAEEIDGDRGYPWLRIAGDRVANRHGAY